MNRRVVIRQCLFVPFGFSCPFVCNFPGLSEVHEPSINKYMAPIADCYRHGMLPLLKKQHARLHRGRCLGPGGLFRSTHLLRHMPSQDAPRTCLWPANHELYHILLEHLGCEAPDVSASGTIAITQWSSLGLNLPTLTPLRCKRNVLPD